MKNLIYILNILMILIFASCKDESIYVVDDNEPCYTIFVSAPETPDTRAVYKDNGSNIAVKWETGDMLTLTTGGDNYYFFFKEFTDNTNVAKFYHYGDISTKGGGNGTHFNSDATLSFGKTAIGQNVSEEQTQKKNNECREYLTANVGGKKISEINASKPVELYPDPNYSILHISVKSPASFKGGSLLNITGLANKEYNITLGTDHTETFVAKDAQLDVYVIVPVGMTISAGSAIKFYFYAYEDGYDIKDGDEYHYYMKCNANIVVEEKKVVKLALPDRPTHAAIQMGLSTKWATTNIGASSESEYGTYFWWGDVEGHTSNFSQNNASTYYKKSAQDLLSGGVLEQEGDYNFLSCKLTKEYDAAAQKWGDAWRLPTREDFLELVKNCTWTWKDTGVKGYTVTRNGKSIFLPASGWYENSEIKSRNDYGYYLSSCLSRTGSEKSSKLMFRKSTNARDGNFDGRRYTGHTVRPVMAKYKTERPQDLEGTLPGEFTVSPTKKVKFSKGNLQYQASTNTWRFAANQYDAIWGDNKNLSDSYSGWIDLFGWGTSGWNSGANEYQPWAHSRINADYYPGGNKENSLTDDYAEADWGIHNAISNGGGKSGLWRVFTKDEAYCILESRTNAKKLFTKATVNDIPGVILYPDFLEKPDDVPITMGLNEDKDYYENKISVDQWKILEFWGVVFLPITAYRNNTKPQLNEPGDGTDVVQYGEYNTDSRDNKKMTGSYWTSTKHDEIDKAWVIVFNNKTKEGKIKTGGCERRGGCGVRLIHEVK